MSTTFTWPSYPKTEQEFEALMSALDTELDKRGLSPFQRPLHVPRLLWEALNWEGDPFPPRALALQTGYQGPVLMAKAIRWYDSNYGEKLKSDFGASYVPVKLVNGLWRVQIPKVVGSVQFFVDRNLQNKGTSIGSRGKPATHNALCSIEDLPQGFANRLTDDHLKDFLNFFAFTFECLQWSTGLPTNNLLQVAYADYAASTSDFFADRFGQSRWGAQQAVEKTIKGLLTLGGTTFPKDGHRGHDLLVLAQLLDQHHAITLDPTALHRAKCTAKIRYGEEPSSQSEALDANHAVLTIWANVKSSAKIAALVRT